MWLLVPFVILPIVEIALFIQIGGVIGVLPTIALVILSAVAGAAVMRRQGRVAATDIQSAMQEFRDPAKPMAHGALVMIAGLLMIVPGFFTSAVGLLLLIPFVRDQVLRWMGKRARMAGVKYRNVHAEVDFGEVGPGYGRRTGPQSGVIDGEYSVQDDPPAPVREGLTDGRSDQDRPRRGNSGWTRH